MSFRATLGRNLHNFADPFLMGRSTKRSEMHGDEDIFLSKEKKCHLKKHCYRACIYLTNTLSL